MGQSKPSATGTPCEGWMVGGQDMPFPFGPLTMVVGLANNGH
jgi:hypothetical protein